MAGLALAILISLLPLQSAFAQAEKCGLNTKQFEMTAGACDYTGLRNAPLFDDSFAKDVWQNTANWAAFEATWEPVQGSFAAYQAEHENWHERLTDDPSHPAARDHDMSLLWNWWQTNYNTLLGQVKFGRTDFRLWSLNSDAWFNALFCRPVGVNYTPNDPEDTCWLPDWRQDIHHEAFQRLYQQAMENERTWLEGGNGKRKLRY